MRNRAGARVRTNPAVAGIHGAVAGRRRIGQGAAEALVDAAAVVNEAAWAITVDMTETLREVGELEAEIRGLEL